MMRCVFLVVASSADASTNLRDAANKRGRFVGAAINAGHISSDDRYKQTAIEQYNLVTAENACKWGATESQEGQFSFSECDKIRDFALNSMHGSFRGHNLCWGSYNPSWLKSLSPAQKKAALIAHIKAVAEHYKTDAFAWDVVNEAITDNGGASDPLKSTDWYPDVPDYIDVAFTTARESFGKDVKLFYNDYNIGSSSGWSQKKSDRVYEYVKGMQSRNIPIDGVGLQMHISSTYSKEEIAGLKTNIKRLGALGLDVHITELDISFDSWGQDQEKQQAQLYSDLLQACLDVPACKNFETWGYTDKYTWKGTDKHPLPFDEKLGPKLAVTSMINVLDSQDPPAPIPSPSPSPARQYETLTQTCQNAEAISGELAVGSVSACQKLCDEKAGCIAVDTNGRDCYLKSACQGIVGSCSDWCAYRVTDVVVV